MLINNSECYLVACYDEHSYGGIKSVKYIGVFWDKNKAERVAKKVCGSVETVLFHPSWLKIWKNAGWGPL